MIALPLFALWAAYTAVLAILYLRVPPCPDHVVYDYIGWIIGQGGAPYVDAADQNWPGQMFIHALSVLLFGSEIWSYRAFELVVILPASCAILFIFLRRYDDILAAWLVVPLYQTMYLTSGFWMSGQRDIVAAPLLVAASYCLLRRASGAGRRYLILQGLCLAGATLIRPTLLLMAPLLTLADLLMAGKSHRTLRTILGDHTVVCVSILLPISAIVVAAIPSGALRAWYDVTIVFNLEVYSHSKTPWEIVRALLPPVLRSWHWFILWGVVGAVRYGRKNPRVLITSGMILPVAALSVLVQGKGLLYHLGVLLPLIGLLIAGVVASAARYLASENRRLLPAGLAIILVGVPVAGLAHKVSSVLALQRRQYLGQITRAQMYGSYTAGVEGLSVQDVLAVSEYVQNTTDPNDSILVWGRPCHVYCWAGRRSATFAAGFAILYEPGPDFSLFSRWRGRLEATMTSTPPALLMLIKNKKTGRYRGFPEPGHSGPKIADVIREHLPEYRLETSIGLVDIYRLIRSHPGPGAPRPSRG